MAIDFNEIQGLLTGMDGLVTTRIRKAVNGGYYEKLNPARQRFVDEYVIDLSPKCAAERAGLSVSTAYKLMYGARTKEVIFAIQEKLAEREAVSMLKADYVREYIRDILEFCPTDFFQPALDGGWTIDPSGFAALPPKVKRLIEAVEMRDVRGVGTYLAVKFVSKTGALAMAAKYTLTQSVEVTTPWDSLARPKAEQLGDEVERQLLALEKEAYTVGASSNGHV